MDQLIGYSKCSTCQAAKKSLKEQGFQFEERDIKEERLNEEELRSLIKRSGLTVKQFFNTSGLKYKELKLKEKLPLMSEEEQLKLLASDGMLVKRPIFIHENTVILGKKEKEYARLKNIQQDLDEGVKQ